MIHTRKPASVRELFASERSAQVIVILTTPGALDGHYDYLAVGPGSYIRKAHRAVIGAHLGRRIYWIDLTEDQRQAIVARLT